MTAQVQQVSKSTPKLVNGAFWSTVMIWSTTPLMIKWSSEGAGFVFGALARITIGTLLSFLLIKLLKTKMSWSKKSIQSYSAGALGVYFSLILVYWGAQFIPSGLISVLFGLLPFVTAIIASLVLKEDSLSLKKIFAIGLGFSGLIVIFQTDFVLENKFWWGLAAVLVAILFQSISTISVKKINAKVSALSQTYGSLLIALPFYLVTWLFLESGNIPTSIDDRSLIAILYLGTFGSVLGFIFYFFSLQHMEASKFTLITLITPVSALILGNLLNGEVMVSTIWIGAGLILLGLLSYR